VGVSRAFIPFWNPGTGGSAVPPYLVEINWAATAQIYILFGILFISALLALGGLLLRMRMFQAVKLGETA
jgi:putative ABC transport system permease protein